MSSAGRALCGSTCTKPVCIRHDSDVVSLLQSTLQTKMRTEHVTCLVIIQSRLNPVPAAKSGLRMNLSGSKIFTMGLRAKGSY